VSRAGSGNLVCGRRSDRSNLNRGVVFGGATWQVLDRLTATTEVYTAPADAVTVRLALRATIGP
jgi:hypothetical protein